MNLQSKTKKELIIELQELIQENNSLKAIKKERAAKLITANKELLFQNEEKEKRAAELIIANKELLFQNEEKGKRAEELIIADKELLYQGEEKEKRADELIDANKELLFQNEEKEKRAAELVIADKELLYQSEEKEKRAAELIIANKELLFQNEEKEKRAAELIIANKELLFQNEEKEKRATELINANKELAQFAYLTTHDLQEPLKTLSTFTQLLAKRYNDKLDSEGQQFIHYIIESALRMKGLINDLLTYSMIGKSSKTFSQVNCNIVFSKVIHKYANSIKGKNAAVTADALPLVLGDEGQLVQLLQNLVENALNFCNTAPVVHISAKEEPDYYLFSVKDNGIGIDQQYAERIFLIFQRLVNRQEYSGTGMGLAVCKRIVERHGGKIWFESKLGEGTTFYFTIAKNMSTSETEAMNRRSA
jgi:signal transduction histidine kinase